MRWPICFLVVLWTLFSATCTASALSNEHKVAPAPPHKCELVMGTWCILQDNVTIQDTPSSDPAYKAVWKIWGSYWKNFPSVILEPRGCRANLSDTLELLSFDGKFPWDGKKWNAITVKLRKDGSCNLRLLSPTLSDDEVGTAFSTNISLIRACQSEPCLGPTIGERIWPAVQRQ